MLPALEPAGFQAPGSVPFDTMMSRYFAFPGRACAAATFGSIRPMKGENIASMPRLRVNSRRFQLRRIIVSDCLESFRTDQLSKTRRVKWGACRVAITTLFSVLPELRASIRMKLSVQTLSEEAHFSSLATP